MVTARYMFNGCASLDTLAVANWDVSNVTSIDGMFFLCTSVEHLDLSLWDVSNVTSMYRFARGCTNLISISWAGWDVSSVTNFSEALNGNTNLVTADVSTWNTSSATRIDGMFESCTSLVGLDPSGWDVSEVTNGIDFARSVEMSTANYNATLVNWEAQSVQNNVSVNFGSSKYSLASAAATARAALIADYAWTITDGGGI
jgi:surface protein